MIPGLITVPEHVKAWISAKRKASAYLDARGRVDRARRRGSRWIKVPVDLVEELLSE